MKMIQKGLFRVCFNQLPCWTVVLHASHGKYDHIIHNSPAIMNIRTFVALLSRNPQYDFPKIHPFWWRHPSLSDTHTRSFQYVVLMNVLTMYQAGDYYLIQRMISVQVFLAQFSFKISVLKKSNYNDILFYSLSLTLNSINSSLERCVLKPCYLNHLIFIIIILYIYILYHIYRLWSLCHYQGC